MVKNFKNEIEIEIPENVDVTLKDKIITIKGDKGELTKDLSHARQIDISLDGKIVRLHSYFSRTSTIATMGTLNSIINNAIIGVTEGYRYRMMIAYSHFPITVEPPKTKKGHDAIQILNFQGERSPRTTYTAGPNISIKADKDEVTVEGVDKEAVGQTCANIQKRCRIRRKDSRVFQDGIYVYSKEYSTGKVLWRIK
ncbi:MAG: 50S ribosomal protein L6 [Candidatus Lokiarchaeota archaeon]|nr:50S ribosomal protein L6 [Candidatus Lokiarchaeota archaeon]